MKITHYKLTYDNPNKIESTGPMWEGRELKNLQFLKIIIEGELFLLKSAKAFQLTFTVINDDNRLGKLIFNDFEKFQTFINCFANEGQHCHDLKQLFEQKHGMEQQSVTIMDNSMLPLQAMDSSIVPLQAKESLIAPLQAKDSSRVAPKAVDSSRAIQKFQKKSEVFMLTLANISKNRKISNSKKFFSSETETLKPERGKISELHTKR